MAPVPSSRQLVGKLLGWDENEKVEMSISLVAAEVILIGRNPRSCQVVVKDPRVSKKHLRIYSIIFDQDDPDNVAPLVYAQDMSFNGTFWNGFRINKETGSVLLSDGDTLKLCGGIVFTFRAPKKDENLFSKAQVNEIMEFQHKYLITNRMLGSGAYGQVYMAVRREDGEQLACKIVDLNAIKAKLRAPRSSQVNCELSPEVDIDSPERVVMGKISGRRQQLTQTIEERIKTYDREVEVLHKLRHPNIIGIERVYKTENTLYMIQDLVPAGDLFSFLEFKKWELHEVEAAVIIRQITIALDYLHDNMIVHRDLKPDNILMTSLASNCRIVLADFGCARYIPRETSRMASVMGTFEYKAPEIERSLIKKGYTKSVDLWSLGCVTVVLLTGGSPFQHPDTLSYSRELARECDLRSLEKMEGWSKVGNRAKNFVGRLLVLDENKRMTAKEALQHEWFTNSCHRRFFDEIYQKAIYGWRPRASNNDGRVFNPDHCGNKTEKTPGKPGSCDRLGHKSCQLQEAETDSWYDKNMPGSQHTVGLCGRNASLSLSDPDFRSQSPRQSFNAVNVGSVTPIIAAGDELGINNFDTKELHHESTGVPDQVPDGSSTYLLQKPQSEARLPFSPGAWDQSADSFKLNRPFRSVKMGPPNTFGVGNGTAG